MKQLGVSTSLIVLLPSIKRRPELGPLAS